jgi:hypothetical protein
MHRTAIAAWRRAGRQGGGGCAEGARLPRQIADTDAQGRFEVGGDFRSEAISGAMTIAALYPPPGVQAPLESMMLPTTPPPLDPGTTSSRSRHRECIAQWVANPQTLGSSGGEFGNAPSKRDLGRQAMLSHCGGRSPDRGLSSSAYEFSTDGRSAFPSRDSVAGKTPCGDIAGAYNPVAPQTQRSS